jgi:hypothetical protein
VGLEYLLRPFEEGELITTDLIEMLYEFQDAPYEKQIAEVIGEHGSLRRSHYASPAFWTAYTTVSGMVAVDLTYLDFGRTDDCDIDISILANEISALVYRQALSEGKISTPPAARGGLHIEYRDGAIGKVTYWSQLDKEGSDDTRQLDPSTGLDGAYRFLVNRCEEEKEEVFRKALARTDKDIDAYLEGLPLIDN